MHLLIASLAFLAVVAAAQAQEPRFSALAAPSHPASFRHAQAQEPWGSEAGGHQDGFSGSFSARQTAKNLGY